MGGPGHRGSPVIYVAASARELPTDVQDWLGRADNRAVASPDVFDMVALLGLGRQYAAILVSIDGLDWDELEFFDLAARLSPDTLIYVIGSPHQRAKMDAACRRGARPFDIEALDDALAPPVVEYERPRVAARSEPAAVELSAAPVGHEELATTADADAVPEGDARPELAARREPAELEPDLEPEAEQPSEGRDADEAGALAAGDLQAPVEAPLEAQSAEAIVAPAGSPPLSVGPVEPIELTAEASDDPLGAEGESDPRPLEGDGEADQGPRVRLLPAEAETEEEDSPAISYPWSPSPLRPRRTPPSTVARSTPPVHRAMPNVELTAEEIAALMGRQPDAPDHRDGGQP